MDVFKWRPWAPIISVCGAPLSSALTHSTGPEIEVLPSHPSLVTGGDTLVRIADSAIPTLTVSGNDVTAMVEPHQEGAWVDLVDGLSDGENAPVAAFVGSSETLMLVNHPTNGTHSAGPQQMAFVCENDVHDLAPAADETCAAPTVVDYFYRNDTGDWLPFDPEDARPNDIGMTVTTKGDEVPKIARVGKGVINRAAHAIGLLHDHASGPAPTPTSRKEGWDGKLVYSCAGGLPAENHMGNIIGQLDASRAQFGGYQNQVHESLIEGGYALAGGSLTAFRVTTNNVASAETTAKVKKRFVEIYGPPVNTIGTGGTGGSIQQHPIANDYTGPLDGVFLQISHPDAVTFFWPFNDSDLLVNCLDSTHTEWTPRQMDQVSSKHGWHYYSSSGPVHTDGKPRSEITCDAAVDNAIIFGKIDGPRCNNHDHSENIFGIDPDTGVAGALWDNTGVQCELNLPKNRVILFEEYIDLDANTGGHDTDGNFRAARSVGKADAFATIYRSGGVSMGGGGLASVPVIDNRGFTDGVRTVAPCQPRAAQASTSMAAVTGSRCGPAPSTRTGVQATLCS